jgi:hypothetical protein
VGNHLGGGIVGLDATCLQVNVKVVTPSPTVIRVAALITVTSRESIDKREPSSGHRSREGEGQGSEDGKSEGAHCK